MTGSVCSATNLLSPLPPAHTMNPRPDNETLARDKLLDESFHNASCHTTYDAMPLWSFKAKYWSVQNKQSISDKSCKIKRIRAERSSSRRMPTKAKNRLVGMPDGLLTRGLLTQSSLFHECLRPGHTREIFALGRLSPQSQLALWHAHKLHSSNRKYHSAKSNMMIDDIREDRKDRIF